jgi:hypothetical protein
MEQRLPAPREEAPIQEAPASPAIEAAAEPEEPEQDFSIVLLPIAIVVFLVLTFIAAAWTLLASIGA